MGVRARIDGLRVPSATHMTFDSSVVTPAAIERASQLSGAQCCVINLYHHVTKRTHRHFFFHPSSLPRDDVFVSE